MQCRTATAAHCTEKTREDGAVDWSLVKSQLLTVTCFVSLLRNTTAQREKRPDFFVTFVILPQKLLCFFPDAVAKKSLSPSRYNHCHYSTILTKLANFLNQFQNLLLPYCRVWRSNNSSIPSPFIWGHSNFLQRLARLKTKTFQRRYKNFSSHSLKTPQTTTRYVGWCHRDVIYIRWTAGSRLSL